jgi:hypothetical protein
VTDGTFAALRVGFERASAAGTVETSDLRLAGRPVRMRVAGQGLARSLARPLAHLAAPANGADLTIELWDAEETGVPSPLAPRADGAVAASPNGRYLVYEQPYSVIALDRAGGRLVGCVESRWRLPDIERARPLNVPLTIWCGDRDVHVIHAGLVARRGHGVLLAGMAEAGKSTTALVCAGAGFEFLADDCVALSHVPAGEFEGHSLYGSVSLEPGHLARFPPAVRAGTDGASPGDEKALLFLAEARRVVPVRAVALPRIVDQAGSGAALARKSDALLRLAPGSLIKRAVSPRTCMRAMARLVDQVPSYWLDLDPDLDAIPPRVDALLAEAGLR